MTIEVHLTTRPAAEPLPDRSATPDAPGRSARLLGLVRGLIAFGQALLQTLHASPAASVLADIGSRFGTRDIALIIARITRGLLLAASLDARLVRGAARLDAAPTRAGRGRAAARGQRRSACKPLAQNADDVTLPTAAEIAARVRGRPLGVVLEQICHDLGITCDHPLWPELQMAILAHGGRLDRSFAGIVARVTAGYEPPTDLVPRPGDGFAARLSSAMPATGPPH